MIRKNIFRNSSFSIVYILMFVFLGIISCKQRDKAKSVCVKKISYDAKELTLSPSLLKIIIIDSNNEIIKKIDSGLLKDIILYSIKKEDWVYFRKINYHEINDNEITIGLETNYYNFDENNRWSSEKVERSLEKNIGLVIGKDTLKITQCQ